MRNMKIIQTKFKGALSEIQVYAPGKVNGQRTDFEEVYSPRTVSFVTSSLVSQTSDVIKYEGDSIIRL
jgi:hypothetical protein